jgi:UDP-glucose 4-epimerase
MSILITGGAGYIGTHTCVELLNKGEDIIVVDNFYNSKPQAIENVKQITGKDFKFYEANILDREKLVKIFEENNIESVIHFAGLKAVGESVQKPIEYYTNNVAGSLVLFDVMKQFGCKRIVFSSSATVYGKPEKCPITEDMALSTTNPYGTTKLHIEQILRDIYVSDNEWSISLLRYFNPIGAHTSGLIGEVPSGIPNNIMPYISKVASKKLEKVNIFGNDYNTSDGTGVRDYIHVVDLASGHLNALNNLRTKQTGIFTYNLGTGNGYSVLDLIKTFEQVNNVEVPYMICDRRPGDIATCYSDTTKAETEIGFKAVRTLEDMCRDTWNFERNL